MSGQLTFKWDPKNYEIRSRSVELQLEPLVLQVTTLVESGKTAKKGRGKSKKAAVLVAAVERAIANFIEKGEQIANENPEVKTEMLKAVDAIRTTGNTMITASKDFAAEPCATPKRTEMIKAARSLLAAVTRLLILADMIDVQLLLTSVKIVQDNLERIRNAKTDAELVKSLDDHKRYTNDLLNNAARRQQELNDPKDRDDLAAARAVLKTSYPMLLSASKAYISHPEIAAAKINRDQVLKQICGAVNTIDDLAQGRVQSPENVETQGKLARNLETFERKEVENYTEVRSKVLLEQQLEELINGAMLITDSGNIKNERKDKIVASCNAVREAVQGLLVQSMKRVDNKDKKDEMSRAADVMNRNARDLKRQLQKAIAVRISNDFLDTTTPLLALVEAAQKGDPQQVEQAAVAFQEHCRKLVEIANQVCEMSNNEDGIKMVLHAAQQLENTCPGVINAARIQATQPHSSVAKENMNAYKQTWQSQVQLLIDAVDDITTIDDVLSVMETHIVDEINQYVAALHDRQAGTVASTAESIKARSNRICDLVSAEMDNYEPCVYTRRVLEAVKMLNQQIMPSFDQQTKVVVQSLVNKPDQDIDENEFIDTTRLMYDGVRDVRRAVLMNRANEDLDPEDVELEDAYSTDTMTRSYETLVEAQQEEESEDMTGITVVRKAMSKLPEKDKRKLMQQVENFHSEKQSFDREVAKWDDAGNDIVVLAKYMCVIMMQMTDFVRQRGPLKSTTDVISAAKKISETGTKLDKLTRQIADLCPESSTKKDLLAYLERVALYSHQINIISKVKADVQTNSEQLIVAGVESAMSLIENAKNLMNAVVLTVKASYVASTKYSRHGTVASPIVVWRMKIPEKKPLVRLEKRTEVTAVIRRASQKKPQSPLKVLSEFHSAADFI